MSILTKAFAKIDELSVKHPIMSDSIEILSLIIFFGWFISYEFIAWMMDLDDNELGKELTTLQWTIKWFGIIVFGTAIEALIVLIVGLILMVITYIYIYFIPMGILFGGLYLGRKIYLKKKENTKVEP